MKKFLIIAAEQERLGHAPGPHTFKESHAKELRECVGERAEVVIATPEEAEAHYVDAELVAAFPRRMPPIEKLPAAKWLNSFSAGVDHILTPELAASEVILSGSSGIHATPIAEHVIGFMLNFTRGFQKTFLAQQKHEWKKEPTLGEIRDSKVLIVGSGEIGKETARLAFAFGAHVSAIVRTKRPIEHVEKVGTLEDLDAWLPEADFVVITLPYTQETHHLFNRAKFQKMKQSAVLINIGRGSIVNEPDLIDALEAKEIAGTGLDVTETEPLPATSPLWDLENVIITPHHSGLSHRYLDRAITLLCKNIDLYLTGKPLLTEIDKKLGY